jgi:REP-associated tyrosine transposase
VPSGLVRYYGTNDLHFITCSCYRRLAFLGTPQRRDFFLRLLEEARVRFRFVVCAYVVMPEHFHLLVTEPQIGSPSSVLQNVKQRFAQRILGHELKKEDQTKLVSRHVWQARFYDFNVWTERKRIEKVRYIHRNPVKRGLVRSPEEWRWSSFRFYMFGEEGIVRVNDTSVLTMRVRTNAIGSNH